MLYKLNYLIEKKLFTQDMQGPTFFIKEELVRVGW